MMGILTTAFDLAARGIADTDPSTSALARSYNLAAANWIKNYAYWPLRKGLYYGAQYVNCQAPIADNNGPCTGNNGNSAARTLSSEVMRGIGAAYANSGDSSLQVLGDTLFSAMFSKPGFGGPNPDGFYVSDWDDAVGWFMIGAPPVGRAPKYFGMFFGFGDGSSWPAYRQSAVAATSTATAYLSIDAPAGVRVRTITTAPSGRKVSNDCGRTRCTVEYDPRQGEHLITIEYLSPTGTLLRSEVRTVTAIHE